MNGWINKYIYLYVYVSIKQSIDGWIDKSTKSICLSINPYNELIWIDGYTD